MTLSTNNPDPDPGFDPYIRMMRVAGPNPTFYLIEKTRISNPKMYSVSRFVWDYATSREMSRP